MYSQILKSLAALALATAGTVAMAQVSGGVSGGGVSGISGVSGGLGIDFAAGQAAGSNTEKNGGFAQSVEEAMGGAPSQSGGDCGKLKCD